jgi:dihydrofolate synthase / folylpolyglutamate synthase
MIETYEEAVQFLYQNLPIFQRVGSEAYRPDLTNTIKLCEALGNPQRKFKNIHVAGTNGKGSTSHMLSAILQCAGYKTGLYTSPHLKSFTERIKVDGKDVSHEFVIDFVNRVRPLIHEIKPSFFEITVVMAFEYFAQQQVEVAVIEVGLGGRLDSTNVIAPVVSVITNIGWDHREILGDTLEKIAREKAGIIKHEIPVVISERQTEVEHVFIDHAKRMQSKIIFASDIFEAQPNLKYETYLYSVRKQGQPYLNSIQISLQGLYQQKNLQGVLATIEVLQQNDFNISSQHIVNGLKNTTSLTNFKGRWQKLSESPLMICDTGHNIDGVREVLKQVGMQRVSHTFMIWGMVKDKDVTEILNILPKDATYYFCEANIPRAMAADVLAEKAAQVGLKGEVIRDVNEAIRHALVQAKETDLIFIGGSTFIVAEIDGL